MPKMFVGFSSFGDILPTPDFLPGLIETPNAYLWVLRASFQLQ
jgi:hypothetical protein